MRSGPRRGGQREILGSECSKRKFWILRNETLVTKKTKFEVKKLKKKQKHSIFFSFTKPVLPVFLVFLSDVFLTTDPDDDDDE